MIEKLKAALEALEAEQPWHAMEDLRSVIAEMESAEPVAHLCRRDSGFFDVLSDKACKECFPVYTHPQPKAEPLSASQISDILAKDKPISMAEFARAIEAAHGIK